MKHQPSSLISWKSAWAVATAFCLASLLGAEANAAGEKNFETSIRIEDGEHWFGGAVNLGEEQPYDATTVSKNRRYGKQDFDLSCQCWGGATVPFLLSDKGRYVWSDRPFRYRFDSGTLHIVSRAEEVRPVVAGQTLKEAYFDACRKHFPFTGGTPPEEFFVKPQFNNWIEMYLRGVNQAVCEAYADEIATNNFPCGVHMVDGGWMLYHGAVRFNPDDYPDPVRLFDKLHGYGWNIADSAIFRTMDAADTRRGWTTFCTSRTRVRMRRRSCAGGAASAVHTTSPTQRCSISS